MRKTLASEEQDSYKDCDLNVQHDMALEVDHTNQPIILLIMR